MDLRQVTVEELTQHKSPKSLWMVIDGFVFDLTDLLQSHPGGESILLEFAGSDGSDCFDRAAHSPGARKVLNLYKVGVLVRPKSTITASASPSVPRARLISGSSEKPSDSPKLGRNLLLKDPGLFPPPSSPDIRMSNLRSPGFDSLSEKPSAIAAARQISRASGFPAKTPYQLASPTLSDLEIIKTSPSVRRAFPTASALQNSGGPALMAEDSLSLLEYKDTSTPSNEKKSIEQSLSMEDTSSPQNEEPSLCWQTMKIYDESVIYTNTPQIKRLTENRFWKRIINQEWSWHALNASVCFALYCRTSSRDWAVIASNQMQKAVCCGA